ncbi:putative hydrolase MhqD [Paraliobacillus ryukyuensis]|uniref:Phospholipase/carboxylesterase n=1 Tax=Paraliobacillus ryukyuensis TaxID=200904 RepID=A0A366DWT7_9BACI|nr:alpha/beta hydrolase [Paraliobacillus ryukyuensis]RBO94556.1 phospholipase/carboxylesterase [Paraliobacillus ryukyuensis]
MKHIFKQGDQNKPVFLLLHGTGGTENDLLPIAEKIDPQASVLSVRGNVNENGLNRFFKRLAEGVFDEADLVKQTQDLYTFLDEAAEQYDFDRDNVIAIGYSNGANIAGSLLFHYKKALKAAILHHPMVPRRNIELPDLTGTAIFIGAGENDPLISIQESNELAEMLKKNGAAVNLHWENRGHQLSFTEIEAAIKWYESL